jgi:hypothetical protein
MPKNSSVFGDREIRLNNKIGSEIKKAFFLFYYKKFFDTKFAPL